MVGLGNQILLVVGKRRLVAAECFGKVEGAVRQERLPVVGYWTEWMMLVGSQEM